MKKEVRYRVTWSEITWPPNKVAKPGEVWTGRDLPGQSIRWLVDQGYLEVVDDDGGEVVADADSESGEG